MHVKVVTPKQGGISTDAPCEHVLSRCGLVAEGEHKDVDSRAEAERLRRAVLYLVEPTTTEGDWECEHGLKLSRKCRRSCGANVVRAALRSGTDPHPASEDVDWRAEAERLLDLLGRYRCFLTDAPKGLRDEIDAALRSGTEGSGR